MKLNFSEKTKKILLKKKGLINVDSRSEDEAGKKLSNLYPSPFILNGKKYGSVEGFWQSLKFPEKSEKREEVSLMSGKAAKKAGSFTPNYIEYNGSKIKSGSPEHHQLMYEALKAKFTQNPELKKLLLDTEDYFIVHLISPNSKNIPEKVFVKQLVKLREELKN